MIYFLCACVVYFDCCFVATYFVLSKVSWALAKEDFLGAVNVALDQRHLLRRHDFQVSHRATPPGGTRGPRALGLRGEAASPHELPLPLPRPASNLYGDALLPCMPVVAVIGIWG